MSSVSPNVIHPGKIENIPDHVADTQTIFIGGPCTGKTAICRSLDETVYVNTGEDLKSLDTDLPIIIDNAYQILTDPQIDASERMRSLEDHQSGVCYVFRPYEFDWIVGNSSNVTFDFDSVQVLSLVYNDSETISELYSIDNNLSENKISSFVDHLEYRFSYSNAPIEDYQSYLPYCSIKASNNAVERIITGDSVMDKITKFAKNSDLSAYTRHATTQIPNSIVATLSGLVGGGAFASGVGAVALFAAAPILINQTLEDEFEFEQNLGEVLGHELLPHHQEKLERETDLPPRTFETLGKFADPVTAQRFNKVVEEQETFRNVIQETTFEVGHDTNSFSELVDLLANETVPITELVSSEFNDAILSPNSLIKRQKKRVIDEIQAAASIPETKAKERVNKLFDQPLREKKLKTDFETKAPDKGTLLAYGEIGGGVTTFAKGMLEKYAVDGYNVGVINSTTPEILRPKLRSMNTESGRLALVYSVGHRGSFSPHDFQSLFGEEVFDLYDVLIIECSQEKIDSIRSAWEQTRDISYTSASSRLQPKAEIQLSGIDQQSLKRIPQTLSTLESEAADVIADTADGNPTIAVEATLETIENGLGSLRGVQGRELIRDRLKGALQELEDNHGKTSLDILVMLAGTRGVDTERSLAELLDIGERKIKMVLKYKKMQTESW